MASVERIGRPSFAMPPSRRVSPYLLLTLTALFWSGNWVVGRALRSEVPPVALAFWRWGLALALLLPFAVPHLSTEWALIRRSWRILCLLGFLGTGGHNALAYIGLQY